MSESLIEAVSLLVTLKTSCTPLAVHSFVSSTRSRFSELSREAASPVLSFGSPPRAHVAMSVAAPSAPRRIILSLLSAILVSVCALQRCFTVAHPPHSTRINATLVVAGPCTPVKCLFRGAASYPCHTAATPMAPFGGEVRGSRRSVSPRFSPGRWNHFECPALGAVARWRGGPRSPRAHLRHARARPSHVVIGVPMETARFLRSFSVDRAPLCGVVRGAAPPPRKPLPLAGAPLSHGPLRVDPPCQQLRLPRPPRSTARGPGRGGGAAVRRVPGRLHRHAAALRRDPRPARRGEGRRPRRHPGSPGRRAGPARRARARCRSRRGSCSTSCGEGATPRCTRAWGITARRCTS